MFGLPEIAWVVGGASITLALAVAVVYWTIREATAARAPQPASKPDTQGTGAAAQQTSVIDPTQVNSQDRATQSAE